MDFSGISNQTLIGKALRYPLKLIPQQMRILILQGQLKGKKWIVGSSQHGCWLGSYEYEKQLLFQKMISPGSIVFDLGAHVGFYTLLASVLVGSKGQVFAFEPMPKNLHYLKEHLQINQINNVTVTEAAVSEKSGVAYFEQTESSFQGHLSSQGSIRVDVVSLDELIAEGKIPTPDYIKMDVEGAEVQVLHGAKSLIEKSHPTIFLATHGDEIQRECRQFLSSLGYQLKSINGKSLEESDEILAE